jgi:YD repeat-containing protein
VYDGLDRLTQEVTAQGTVNYTYDSASQRATMTVVGQPQVVYTYDNANRLTTITQGASTVTMGYDNADRRTSVTYPNTNSVTYGYNVASELTSITYKQGATTLGDLTYTYDATGNRTKTGGTFARSNIPPAPEKGSRLALTHCRSPEAVILFSLTLASIFSANLEQRFHAFMGGSHSPNVTVRVSSHWS